MQLSKTKYVLIGLVVIIIIYSLYYKTLIYVNYYAAVPRVVRQTGRLLTILLVYGTGRYVFKKYGVKWICSVWNYIYLAVVIVLVLLGGVDVALKHNMPLIRSIAGTLHELLISPVLYAALLIINRAMTNLTPDKSYPGV